MARGPATFWLSQVQLGPCFLWLQPFGADGGAPCDAQGNWGPSLSGPSAVSCTSEPGAQETSHEQGLSQGKHRGTCCPPLVSG